MFDDTAIEILGNSPVNTSIKNIYADVQEYSTVIEIENYKFDVTKRTFLDYIEQLINIETYLKINGVIFKILKIKIFSDYEELWLYELERQVV